MHRIEAETRVHAPLRKVYNQWTQFEEFPKFMENVKSVRQLDDTHLHWCAEIGGKDLEWDAEILDQVPDQRIVWRSTSGVRQGGKVEFESTDRPNETLIRVVMEYEPEGVLENIGDALGVAERQVKADLNRFKDFIEETPDETGAWRGEVHRGEPIASARSTPVRS